MPVIISDVTKTLVPRPRSRHLGPRSRPRPRHQTPRPGHQMKITLFTQSGNRYWKSGMVWFHQSLNRSLKQENKSKTVKLSVGYISYSKHWARYWQLKYWTSFYLKAVGTEITHCTNFYQDWHQDQDIFLRTRTETLGRKNKTKTLKVHLETSRLSSPRRLESSHRCTLQLGS